MTFAYRHFAPIWMLTCVAACDALQGAGEDEPSDDSSGSASSDPTGDTDDPSGPTTADTTDGDPTGADPTGPDTGNPGDALPDTVLLYLHDDGGTADSVRAYDTATLQSWVVTDFGGDVEIRSVAIHPNRTSLAISSSYQLQTAGESEGIWRVPVGGGDPELIMAAIPGDEDQSQNVADLAYTYDGADIYFDYSSSTTGGGTLARVADTGGLPELLLDANGTCSFHAVPSPGPSGTQLLSVRDECVDLGQQGIILHDLPPTNVGQVALAPGDIYEFVSAAPQWSADGTGVVFEISTRIDLDQDGFYDGQGDSLLLWDTQSGATYEMIPPAIEQRIFNFAISPDETELVMCMGTAAGQDLVLVDLAAETLSFRQLTEDGKSCNVVW